MASEEENLVENGDFSSLCGSVPDEWYGFGWCSIAVAEEKHLLYDGKKPCKAFKRSYTYSGMAQPVQYVVETGKNSNNLSEETDKCKSCIQNSINWSDIHKI